MNCIGETIQQKFMDSEVTGNSMISRRKNQTSDNAKSRQIVHDDPQALALAVDYYQNLTPLQNKLLFSIDLNPELRHRNQTPAFYIAANSTKTYAVRNSQA